MGWNFGMVERVELAESLGMVERVESFRKDEV